MSNRKRQHSNMKHLESLYRKAADDEPDRRIDDTVLGMAREAAPASRRHGLRHPRAWGLGMAAAASLVLAVGLYIDQRYRVEIDPPPAVNPEVRIEDRAMEAEESTGASRERVAPAAAPATGDGDASAEQRADQAAYRETRREPAAGQEETGERKAVEMEEAQTAATLAKEPEDLDPTGWLTRIQKLIESGNMEQARRELREFRASYPSTTVPVEIRERLAEAPDDPSG